MNLKAGDMLQINRITSLTSDQEVLIPDYRNKWRSVALSTQPIETEQVKAVVKAIYDLMGLPRPKIHFYPSPLVALEQFNLDYWGSKTVDVENVLTQNLKKQLSIDLWVKLQTELYEVLHQQLWDSIGRRIYSAFNQLSQVMHNLNAKTKSGYFNPARDCIPTEYLVSVASLFDFCYSVFNCSGEQQLWQAYQSLVSHCGWLWIYEQVCLVSERPCILTVDNQGLLHGEGQPAIQLADGFSVYAYHGAILPTKYGTVHPQKWRSQWLIKESNAELRQVLIQGIGYSRICQELKASQRPKEICCTDIE